MIVATLSDILPAGEKRSYRFSFNYDGIGPIGYPSPGNLEIFSGNITAIAKFVVNEDNLPLVEDPEISIQTVESLPSNPVIVTKPVGIPILPQWGLILLMLSFLTIATWYFTGRPALLFSSIRGGIKTLPNYRRALHSLIRGELLAIFGLLAFLIYEMIIRERIIVLPLAIFDLSIIPLTPHDLLGTFLAGLLVGLMIEFSNRGHVNVK